MLLQSFLWTAVGMLNNEGLDFVNLCYFTVMLGYWTGYTLLSVIFRPLLAFLLTDLQALLSTIALLVLAKQNLDPGLDQRSRFNLLYFAVAEGLAVGYVLGDLHLHLVIEF